MTDEQLDPPDGWTVSTATATHISLYHAAGNGRSLVVRPTEPGSEEWLVKGLAGYEPPYPVFADGVARAEAIEEAITVMEVIGTGESVEPLRTESTADGDAVATAGDDNEAKGDAQKEEKESDDAVDQANLTAFASEGDDE